MQIMHIDSLERVGGATVLSGTVQNDTISVGQSFHLTAPDGRRHTVTIVGLIPKDHAAPGSTIKALIRLTDRSFDLVPGMTLSKIT